MGFEIGAGTSEERHQLKKLVGTIHIILSKHCMDEHALLIQPSLLTFQLAILHLEEQSCTVTKLSDQCRHRLGKIPAP